MINKLVNINSNQYRYFQLVVIKIIARTPLIVLHIIGLGVGIISFIFRPKSRNRSIQFAKTAKIKSPIFNVMLSYADFGRSMLEAGWIWLNRPKKTLDKIFVDTKDDVLSEIIAHARGGKPLLFLGCHLGASESAIVYLKKHFDSVVLYQIQKDSWILAIREHTHPEHQIELVKTNIGGIRKLYKNLKNGGAVGISIDQTPYEGSGVWLPFFGKPANTMMLAAKISQLQNIKIVFALHLHYLGGFRIKLVPINNIPKNTQRIALFYNQYIEKYILQYPEQYRWTYDRYRTRAK